MRLPLLLIPIVLQFYAYDVAAQERTEPAYAPRARWSEDWSSLRDFSPLVETETPSTEQPTSFKYIPLDDSGESYLSLGAEYRLAYEIYEDADMGISSIGKQDALQQRVALHADLHLSNEWRVFAELGDGLVTDRDGGNKTADETDPDIWQLFLDRRWHLENGDRIVLRGGRQLIETANLFINAGEGNNVRQTYNGVRTALIEKSFVAPGIGETKGVTRIQQGFVPFEAFAAEYVDFADDAFEMEGTDEYFWGSRVGMDVPEFGARLHFLYTGWDLKDRQFEQGGGDRHDELRHTALLWFNRPLGISNHWGLDYYLAYQFGRYEDQPGDSDIRAFAAFGEVKYAIHTEANTPILGLKTDYFSGDDDPDDGDLNTFYNPVFATPYFGYARDIQPFNLIHVQPNVGYRFGDTALVTLSHGFMWRESSQDAYYGKPNAITARAGVSDSNWLGQQTQLALRYKIRPNILVSSYLGYFFAGDTIEDAGGDDRVYFDVGIHALF
jgi:hypothetical protein